MKLRPLLLVAILTLGALSPGDANAQPGVVEGVARAEDGAAVAFALVRLVRADSGSSRAVAPWHGITSATGHYRFDAVAPGRYRVELLRIGFRPVLSDPVQVAAGETVQLALRVASQPVVLPTVTVTPDVCVLADEFEQHPQLQTLWYQARAGASVRTELMARFRYHVHQREETIARKADGTPTGAIDQRFVIDPRWAVRNAARARAARLARGYYGPRRDTLEGFYVPSELDVLHEDFLKGHCFLPAAARRR